MSTFNGILKEFPLIRIDNFSYSKSTNKPRLAFLSHCHTDHTKGLENVNYSGPTIYCSDVTRRLLYNYQARLERKKADSIESIYKFRHLFENNLIKSLSLNITHELDISPKERVKVTLIDANHCPGAVMFLIEGFNGKSILYTGDMRAESWFINTFTHNIYLSPYIYGYKQLDCIYIDTTFAYRGQIDGSESNNYIDLSSNYSGINYLLTKLKRYPKNTLFWMRNQTFGYEEVMLEIARYFNTRIHVDKYLYNQYYYACQSPRIDNEGILLKYLLPYLTTDSIDAKIHMCYDRECAGSYRNAHVRLYPSTNFNIHQVNDYNSSQPSALTIFEAESIARSQAANNYSQRSLSLYEVPDTNNLDEPVKLTSDLLFCSQNKNPLIPVDFLFQYSFHSSYNETREFIKLFNPITVYPIVQQETYFKQGFNIKDAFGDLCKDNSFLADKEFRGKVAKRKEKEDMKMGLYIETMSFESINPEDKISTINPSTSSHLYGAGKQQSHYKLREHPPTPDQLSSDIQDNDDILMQLYNNTQQTNEQLNEQTIEQTNEQPNKRNHLYNDDSSSISSQPPLTSHKRSWSKFEPITLLDTFTPSVSQDISATESQIISKDQVIELSKQLFMNPDSWFQVSSNLTFRKTC